jgi:hypothetical protein
VDLAELGERHVGSNLGHMPSSTARILIDSHSAPLVAISGPSDAMELTCFKNSIEVHILLALHVVYVYPLLLDN